MNDYSSVQIPKPLDWQVFQRGCIPLFRKLVADPSLGDVGRSGQDQKGIDLLGYRDGNLTKPVGVQCRHVEKLTLADVKKAVAAARAITPQLTELIFATTAKHDARLQFDLHTYMEELVQSGWHLRVTLMGWEALQAEIATCPDARRLFWPGSDALAQTADGFSALKEAMDVRTERVLDAIAITMAPKFLPPLDPKLPPEALNERRDVHERISTFRDLLLEGRTETAIKGLEALRTSGLDLEPFARFRIDTNIGAAHLRAGRSSKALETWRSALTMRPGDPKARANVALGLLATDDIVGARDLARSILIEHPKHAGALSVHIQASIDDETFDPLFVSVEGVEDEIDVIASIIAVLRRRNDQRWHDEAIKAATAYPDDLRFRQWSAEAVLEPIVSDTGVLMGKIPAADLIERVDAAANDLLSVWDKSSDDEAADPEPLAALAQNVAAGLRFCQRPAEAAKVIDKALMRIGRHPVLVRVKALLLIHADDDDQAVRLIGDDIDDPHLALLRGELIASKDPKKAEAALASIDLSALEPPARRVALKLRIELAVDLDALETAAQLLEELKALGEPPAGLAFMQARIDQKQAKAGDVIIDDDMPVVNPPLSPAAATLASLLNAEGADVDFITRVGGAQFLQSLGAEEAASDALHGRVDHSRDSVALRTYVSSSLEAGLIVRVRHAFEAMSDAVASVPFFQRAHATLLWNTGDPRGAAVVLADLRRQFPLRLDILLWHIDCLMRLGEADEIATILKAINDDDFEGTLKACIRLARLFAHVDESERALRLAYRLFLTNRDTPDAWMGLTSVVYTLPDSKERPDLLRTTIDDESVVQFKKGSGGEGRYAIERAPELRHYDSDAIDAVHPIALLLQGLKPGDSFMHPDGEEAVVVSVKNKYLYAFHIALDRYNERFPEANGMLRVQVDMEKPGGLDEMKALMVERRDFVLEHTALYEAGQTPLGGLAMAVGVDPVQAMLGLGEVGARYRVSDGFARERNEALQTLRSNNLNGCVVDGPTFHVIRRLKLESVVAAVCGPIGVTQMTLDNLRERLQETQMRKGRQTGSLAYIDGQFDLRETTPEEIAGLEAMLLSDIAWVEENAQILAAVPKADQPPAVRYLHQLRGGRMFDDIFAASGADRLFLADDLITRRLAAEMEVPGVWLQPVLLQAKRRGLIDIEQYASHMFELSMIGQDFLSVDAATLVAALKLDIKRNEKTPGPRLRGVIKGLGGSRAHPEAHANVVIGFLREIWGDRVFANHREAVTGAVLRQLLRDRRDDLWEILRHVVRNSSDLYLQRYIRAWIDGHFLLSDGATKPGPAAKKRAS